MGYSNMGSSDLPEGVNLTMGRAQAEGASQERETLDDPAFRFFQQAADRDTGDDDSHLRILTSLYPRRLAGLAQLPS